VKPFILTLLIRPGIASTLIPKVGKEKEWITSKEERMKCTLFLIYKGWSTNNKPNKHEK